MNHVEPSIARQVMPAEFFTVVGTGEGQHLFAVECDSSGKAGGVTVGQIVDFVSPRLAFVVTDDGTGTALRLRRDRLKASPLREGQSAAGAATDASPRV